LSHKPQLQDNLTVEESIFASDNEILKLLNVMKKRLKTKMMAECISVSFDDMDRFNAWDFLKRKQQMLSKLKLEDKKNGG
jgi:ATP-binding cassette subfamily F protein uup